MLKRFGKFITIKLLAFFIGIAAFLVVFLIDQIFDFQITAQFYLLSFTLPIFMSSPVFYLLIDTITSLESAHKQLKKMAEIDFLTEVPNRAHFFTLAEQYLADVSPTEQVGLAVIDVDRFKLINDQYGHLAGDEALRSIAQAIQLHKRSGDIFGRFGGDEFVLLCPNITEHELLEITRNMLQHVQALALGDKETKTRLSATIGVTTAEASIASLNQLIASADKALLEAKLEGGGRVKYCKFSILEINYRSFVYHPTPNG